MPRRKTTNPHEPALPRRAWQWHPSLVSIQVACSVWFICDECRDTFLPASRDIHFVDSGRGESAEYNEKIHVDANRK